MYIQPQSVTLPKGYSGNAFRQEDTAPPPRDAPAKEPEVKEAPPDTPGGCPPPEDVPVMGPPPKEEGLFSRLPFLSSLLPPQRKRKEGRCGGEWLIWGIVLFLLLDNNENDLLPLLLLLLLWD